MIIVVGIVSQLLMMIKIRWMKWWRWLCLVNLVGNQTASDEHEDLSNLTGINCNQCMWFATTNTINDISVHWMVQLLQFWAEFYKHNDEERPRSPTEVLRPPVSCTAYKPNHYAPYTRSCIKVRFRHKMKLKKGKQSVNCFEMFLFYLPVFEEHR